MKATLPPAVRDELFTLFNKIPGAFERVGAAIVEGRIDCTEPSLTREDCGCIYVHGLESRNALPENNEYALLTGRLSISEDLPALETWLCDSPNEQPKIVCGVSLTGVFPGDTPANSPALAAILDAMREWWMGRNPGCEVERW